MKYLLLLALSLLLTGTVYIETAYFSTVQESPSLEPSTFKLIPLDSIKPQLLFERFVYKPVFACYPVDNLNKYMPGIDCTAGKPQFNL